MAYRFCPIFVAPSSWLVTIKEVMMSRNRISGLLVAALLVAVAFSAPACKKLSYSNLVANYHFAKANRLFTDRQYSSAIVEYEAALKANPTLVQAYRFLGESYKGLYKPGADTPENKNKETKALAALGKALEIEPNNKEIIFSLGDMYDKLRKFDEAEKLYLRIIELEPGNMGNYYVVAEFYRRYASEMPEVAKKAESMYLRRIEADPENPEAYAYAATYYEQASGEPEAVLGSFAKAGDFWDKRIKLQPDSAEAWLALGINCWSRSYRFQFLSKEERLKLADAAKSAIQKAMDLDPNYPEPYAWMGPLYKAVLAKLEPEKEARYNAEGDRFLEKFQDLRKRAAERKKLEEELKKAA
jgi:tetratricopeptide (TPR) repeat protein